ncbi:PREDICTED: calcium-binding mitochondrial carrier protein SCaMC-2-like [Pseudopodoces humilis]|uniref:calcium-binding mitochondrial carrier protein SCaMC-2-like n=1 Tax=Pseudopodoces humilis TaxID=181119 RepID=UPI0006B7F36D|nr:PREDICTED: calcium-binding mitochondrial carrier protein SCaMC-2-like [Pseudopodoces humilis]
MPGARRSLASPVVSGVLCPCGSPHGSAVESGGGGGNAGSCGRSLSEASEQDRRLRALFQKLDVNRDGALCIHDLAVGLGRLGLHRTELDLRGHKKAEYHVKRRDKHMGAAKDVPPPESYRKEEEFKNNF